MSIKSKKANEIIERGGRLEFTHLGCSIAQNAVIQAEADAEVRDRERAVRAFQASCDNYDNGNCELWYGVESERKCPGEMGCASIDNFLKNYDNDSKD